MGSSTAALHAAHSTTALRCSISKTFGAEKYTKQFEPNFLQNRRRKETAQNVSTQNFIVILD